MSWDKEYKKEEYIWGKQPSLLAEAAVRNILEDNLSWKVFNILDIGCGYGRDAFYLLNQIKCNILGIDTSDKAIGLALEAVHEDKREGIEFKVMDFTGFDQGKFDIVYISNLYQILKKDKRLELIETIKRTLKPEGRLYLSTLSVNDPQHAGQGEPVAGETNSFFDNKFLHLCTYDELVGDFSFLRIRELYEQEYDEPRSTGEIHHHISWILLGIQKGSENNIS